MVLLMPSSTTFTERLGQVMAAFDLIPADIAKMAGVSAQAAKKLVDGDSKSMRSQHAYTFAKRLGISYIWLTVGVGAMREVDEPFSRELLLRAASVAAADRRRAENAARAVLDLPLLPVEERHQLAA
jgi:hypothetical protein